MVFWTKQKITFSHAVNWAPESPGYKLMATTVGEPLIVAFQCRGIIELSLSRNSRFRYPTANQLWIVKIVEYLSVPHLSISATQAISSLFKIIDIFVFKKFANTIFIFILQLHGRQWSTCRWIAEDLLAEGNYPVCWHNLFNTRWAIQSHHFLSFYLFLFVCLFAVCCLVSFYFTVHTEKTELDLFLHCCRTRSVSLAKTSFPITRWARK